MQNFANGFLPANHQGSIFLNEHPVLQNTSPLEKSAEIQKQKLRFLHEVDGNLEARLAHAEAIESAIQNYELAARMQLEVPDVTDISKESEATKKLYGLDAPYENTRTYAAQCLMARRLVERGVRFVELSCSSVGIGAGGAGNPWDQHGDLKKGHGAMAEQVDGPIAALLTDLKQRGMLDETLVIFTGEFGRTPFSQGSNGRDHDPFGFSLWMAGGGMKGGTAYGSTDEFGYKALEDVATVYDLWATTLHQLGIDHEKLTYRWSGRDLRLTDVHGHVWKDLIT
jgi:hypothetical protein